MKSLSAFLRKYNINLPCIILMYSFPYFFCKTSSVGISPVSNKLGRLILSGEKLSCLKVGQGEGKYWKGIFLIKS